MTLAAQVDNRHEGLTHEGDGNHERAFRLPQRL